MPQKDKRLSADKWRAAFDKEGRLTGLDAVLNAVQQGVSVPAPSRLLELLAQVATHGILLLQDCFCCAARSECTQR